MAGGILSSNIEVAALFSEDHGGSPPEGSIGAPLRVELNREARNAVVDDLSKERPAYMRKSAQGGSLGGRGGRRSTPVKSSKKEPGASKRMLRKSSFAGSALPVSKSKKYGSGTATGSPEKSKRSLAERRTNEDELSMLFDRGFSKITKKTVISCSMET